MGYGRVLYQPHKEDPLWKLVNGSNVYAPLDKLESLEKKGINYCMKKAEYSVLYLGKGKKFVCMYFDSNDELIEMATFCNITYNTAIEESKLL